MSYSTPIRVELVEVSPQDLDNLDEYLSRKLAPFGVQTAF